MHRIQNFFHICRQKTNFNLSIKLLPAVGVCFIIGIFLIFSGILLSSDVTQEQYREIQTMAKQIDYPQTQTMAYHLLTNEVIRKNDYFRLVRAYQFETKNIKVYPPEGR